MPSPPPLLVPNPTRTSQELVIRTEREPTWVAGSGQLGRTLRVNILAFSLLGPIATALQRLTLDLQSRACVGVFEVGGGGEVRPCMAASPSSTALFCAATRLAAAAARPAW